MALTAHEDGLCSCGQPANEAHDPESDVYYDVREVTCAACKATQEHGSNSKAEPGSKTYVVAERPPDLVAGSDHDPGDDQADSE